MVEKSSESTLHGSVRAPTSPICAGGAREREKRDWAGGGEGAVGAAEGWRAPGGG